MKLNFKLYIKKWHYYQKVSCVKKFIKKLFYFLCCTFSKYVFQNCEFLIVIIMPNDNLEIKSCVDFEYFI